MWTAIWEIALLVLYLPLTLLFLMCGMLTEEMIVTTAAQWFEFRFCGYAGPVLGLLTLPCLIAAIQLRKKGRHRTAFWLRTTPLLIFTGMIAMCYLLRWLFG